MNRLRAALAAVMILITGLAPAAVGAARGAVTESYDSRSMIVYVPTQLPAAGSRALVIVLHGGLGNAQRIEAGQSEHGLNMDAVAERGGFVVAYLNGTPAMRMMAQDKLTWNAGGGCCGQSAVTNVDDVDYIKSAVDFLVNKYGIDRTRIFGMGHSNGAMMTQRLVCETTLYQAAVSIAGPLNLATDHCPNARGRRILAIHGAIDENVPIAGGTGTRGLSSVAYRSEEQTREVMTGSGADYELQIVQGADHNLNDIGAVIKKTEDQTIAEKCARFFGLLEARH